MPKIVVLPHEDLCPEGAVLEAESGQTVLDVALKNGIGIEHACEKSCACTTCHVIIREGLTHWKKVRSWKMTCWTRHGALSQNLAWVVRR